MGGLCICSLLRFGFIVMVFLLQRANSSNELFSRDVQLLGAKCTILGSLGSFDLEMFPRYLEY
jgi:hypothetical protein